MKKVSSEWIKEYNIKILDPDGWDRKNYDYSFNKEKITRQEFEQRLVRSTVRGRGKQITNLEIDRVVLVAPANVPKGCEFKKVYRKGKFK